MKVVGFAGYSGSGKTTLVEGLIGALRIRGLRVSVVKHAHHAFDIDHEGKDTFRHREAGAFEVIVASSKRMALMREYERDADLKVHHLLAELYEGVDWVLVEGFKQSDLLKIEIHRPSAGKPALYEENDFIVAIATDEPQVFEGKTVRPVLDVNSADDVAQWLVDHADRFEYDASKYV
jgi:molybdopterin-guanine dinucleotide biosynthesis adapter protein